MIKIGKRQKLVINNFASVAPTTFCEIIKSIAIPKNIEI